MAHNAGDQEEPMDTQDDSANYGKVDQPASHASPIESSASDGNLHQPASHAPPVQGGKISSQDEVEDLFSISFKWSESSRPQKVDRHLNVLLQSWFNKGKTKADCTVVKTVGDDCVVIKLKPVPALSELRKLHGQTLAKKNDGPITITSVSLTPPELDTDIPEKASVNPSPSMSQPQAEQVEQSSSVSAVGEETCSCLVPVSHFWYVSHIYEEELKRIQEKNGVTIKADVKVAFEPEEKNGDPQKAFSEFKNLVLSCLNESTGSVIPLKFVDPDQWSEALKIVQKNENKLLLTLSSGNIVVCGPSSSQNDFSRTLNAMQNTNMKASLEDYESEETPLMIDMTSDDPLVTSGFSIEENKWKLLTTSYDGQVEQIKATFNVEFRESGSTEGKVRVKVCYKGPGRNISMENHAVRALVRLYQKTVTSPMSFNQLHGATGISSSLRDSSSAYQSEGVSNGAVVKGRPGPNKKNSEVSTGGGAMEWNGKMTQNTDGTSLPVVKGRPVVRKYVYDMKGGDKPGGKMIWNTYGTSLSGVKGSPGLSKKNSEAPTGGGATAGDDEDETCPICMDVLIKKQQLKCKHAFCKRCLQQSEAIMGLICPVCKDVYGVVEGNQPDGKMTWITYGTSLPGFRDCGSIWITYDIPSGIQTDKHPKPGQRYHGITRMAYLPDNREGNEVLKLLKRAFDQKLIFTVGMSRTTGMDNQVTWNDIHHKTSTTGGPQSFGYPDPDYLSRVRDELKAKGIK